jgi:N-acetyl-gamma-glutamyl-phosphate reductase
MQAVIYGSTGYAGQVLLRLLTEHPDIQTIYPVSSSRAGASIMETDPGISARSLEKTAASGGRYCSPAELPKSGIDAVFGALPHLESAKLLEPHIGSSVVIDLSADFRLKDPELFRHYYGAPPPLPEHLDSAVYGLCEWYRKEIAAADLIAVPGCYPSAALYPLLPLCRDGIVTGPVIINALTGISGAGKKAKTNNLFNERSETARAYNPGKAHRHWAEISSRIADCGGMNSVEISFTPHLVPMKQGMAVSTWTRLREADDEAVKDCFRKYYGNEAFIRLRGEDIPETRQVRWSNRCDIGWRREGDALLLFSVIDNLIKGAAGQAVQAMNIRFRLREDSGLSDRGEF